MSSRLVEGLDFVYAETIDDVLDAALVKTDEKVSNGRSRAERPRQRCARGRCRARHGIRQVPGAGIRTRTSSRPQDFKSRASTSSATPAEIQASIVRSKCPLDRDRSAPSR